MALYGELTLSFNVLPFLYYMGYLSTHLSYRIGSHPQKKRWLSSRRRGWYLLCPG